jgi:hypothetical protein
MAHGKISRAAWETIVWCAVLVASSVAYGAPMILNEYNAVGSTRYLDGDFYSSSDREDAYFKTIPGMTDGRIQGNGGNWFELVVVDDHLDIRGWELRWAETGSSETDGTDPWYGDPSVDQGIITFSSAAAIWSDLRAGTLLSFSEQSAIGVDTTLQGGERNLTDNVSPADVDVTIDLSTDTSYDPQAGDWLIHVSTMGELAEEAPLVTTVTNVAMDGPGNFSVGNDDWQMTILDAADQVVFGPVGEEMTLGGGVSSRNLFKLEGPVAPTTVSAWRAITATDPLYNDGTSSSFGMPNIASTGGGNVVTQDFSPLRQRVGVVVGDMDTNGHVDFDDIDDFVLGLNNPVLYQSTFGVPPALMGDTDGNGLLDFDDIVGFVNVLNGGGLMGEESMRAVPEPAILQLLALGMASALLLLQRRQRAVRRVVAAEM